MTNYKAGTPAEPQPWGPVVLGVRHTSTPVPASPEGSWSPFAVDADGRLAVAALPRDNVNTSYSATAAQATAVTITLAAQAPDLAWQIAGLTASYSAAPAAGSVVINDGASATYFQAHVTAAGPTHVTFPAPKVGAGGTALVATLASGAGTVVGMLNAHGVSRVLAPGYTSRLGGILDFSDPNQSGLI